MNSVRVCPNCASQETVRFHRKPIERLMIVMRPYRCIQCDHKFYAMNDVPNLGPFVRELLHEFNPFRQGPLGGQRQEAVQSATPTKLIH